MNFNQIKRALTQERKALAKQAKSIQVRMQNLGTEAADIKNRLIQIKKIADILNMPATPEKRVYKKRNKNLPTSLQLRTMICNILMDNEIVSNKELLSTIHKGMGIKMPTRTSLSPLTPRIYMVVTKLRKDRLVKTVGTRKLSATTKGRDNKDWGVVKPDKREKHASFRSD